MDNSTFGPSVDNQPYSLRRGVSAKPKGTMAICAGDSDGLDHAQDRTKFYASDMPYEESEANQFQAPELMVVDLVGRNVSVDERSSQSRRLGERLFGEERKCEGGDAS